MAGSMEIVFKLRDKNPAMAHAWRSEFGRWKDIFQVSEGDIFKGAPAVDAIVSPANSFGFMDGGIDMIYSLHFGWQMQRRLQEKVQKDFHGEVLVGQAAIILAMDPTFSRNNQDGPHKDWTGCNEGKPIKWLISAPTMRVPMKVDNTANAFLAFRGVLLAVKAHNANRENDPILSVLCPGLGTAVGMMPPQKCAYQMRQAYEAVMLGQHPDILCPKELYEPMKHHRAMITHTGDNETTQDKTVAKQTAKVTPAAANLPVAEQYKVKDFQIKTGVVKRLARDVKEYHIQAMKQQALIDKMESDGKDEYDVRKQREVLEETNMMIPNSVGKLGQAWDVLDNMTKHETSLEEHELYKSALKMLEDTKEAAGR